MSVADQSPTETAVTGLLGLAIGLALWSAVVAAFDLPAYLLPAPSAVAGELAAHPDLYLRNAWVTLQKILLGGGLGALLGFLAGTVIGHSAILRATLLPYIVSVRVLPKIAIAPVLLIYFGLGYETAILFVVLVAFFPMVITTAASFHRVPDRHRDLVASVNASPLAAFLRVRLPFALPDVFAGLKQTLVLSVVGAIIAEWVVSTSGLGYLVLIAGESVQTTMLVATLLVLFALGLGLYGCVAIVQRWLPYGRF